MAAGETNLVQQEEEGDGDYDDQQDSVPTSDSIPDDSAIAPRSTRSKGHLEEKPALGASTDSSSREHDRSDRGPAGHTNVNASKSPAEEDLGEEDATLTPSKDIGMVGGEREDHSVPIASLAYLSRSEAIAKMTQILDKESCVSVCQGVEKSPDFIWKGDMIEDCQNARMMSSWTAKNKRACDMLLRAFPGLPGLPGRSDAADAWRHVLGYIWPQEKTVIARRLDLINMSRHRKCRSLEDRIGDGYQSAQLGNMTEDPHEVWQMVFFANRLPGLTRALLTRSLLYLRPENWTWTMFEVQFRGWRLVEDALNTFFNIEVDQGSISLQEKDKPDSGFYSIADETLLYEFSRVLMNGRTEYNREMDVTVRLLENQTWFFASDELEAICLEQLVHWLNRAQSEIDPDELLPQDEDEDSGSDDVGTPQKRTGDSSRQLSLNSVMFDINNEDTDYSPGSIESQQTLSPCLRRRSKRMFSARQQSKELEAL